MASGDSVKLARIFAINMPLLHGVMVYRFFTRNRQIRAAYVTEVAVLCRLYQAVADGLAW
jgi:hypothetical protein